MHGILLGYEIRYAKNDSLTMMWKSKGFDAETRKIVLGDLAAFTRYRVVVCARTSKGCGKQYSDIVTTWEDGELLGNNAKRFYKLSDAWTSQQQNSTFISPAALAFLLHLL